MFIPRSFRGTVYIKSPKKAFLSPNIASRLTIFSDWDNVQEGFLGEWEGTDYMKKDTIWRGDALRLWSEGNISLDYNDELPNGVGDSKGTSKQSSRGFWKSFLPS